MFGAKPWILGLSSAFHNGAACLLHGDEIVVAIQEERLTRIKRERLMLNRPSYAIDYCLAAAGIKPTTLDCIVDSTIVPPSELPEAALQTSSILREARDGVKALSVSHHLAHAISAFATSGFSESSVLVVDGGGSFAGHLSQSERAAALSLADEMCEHLSIYRATRRGIEAVEKHFAFTPYLSEEWKGMPRFASFGHMFSSAAHQIFGEYLEAGKVMGLAPRGRATIPVSDFFSREGLEFRFLDDVPQRFQGTERWPAQGDEYANLAASTQRALEAGLQEVVERLKTLRLSRNLCYAGGVALNGVANHNVLQRANFKNLHVIPAAEDSGTAIGAAYYGLMQLRGRNKGRRLRSDFLGRAYTAEQIDDAIAETEDVMLIETENVLDSTVDLLGEGKVVGWFQGGAEFGPRALGHRSILFDPRNAEARTILNEKVKYREPYRPFAPAVLAEQMSAWFETDARGDLFDFMLEVCPFRKHLPGPEVPGVTHVDGTGRPQSVSATSNPRFYELIQKFYAHTGVPMIINTSFNIAGEPIVETPADALRCLLHSGLDFCVLENRLVGKR